MEDGAAGAILVIDDNRDMRRVLIDIISFFLGIPVYTAANGHEGVQLFQRQRQSIGLILLDMNMPVMNGEQTYQKLQQIAPQVKVIISSRLSRAEVNQRLGNQEPLPFLQMPCDSRDLITLVQAELASLEAAGKAIPANGRSPNGKNGNGHSRWGAEKLYSQLAAGREAQQQSAAPNP
jgi:DNA-binding NtrC family response regulator